MQPQLSISEKQKRQPTINQIWLTDFPILYMEKKQMRKYIIYEYIAAWHIFPVWQFKSSVSLFIAFLSFVNCILYVILKKYPKAYTGF